MKSGEGEVFVNMNVVVFVVDDDDDQQNAACRQNRIAWDLDLVGDGCCLSRRCESERERLGMVSCHRR